jgi:hypothetical protein
MKQQFLFDMPLNYTIDFKGEKQVAMKTTGSRKLHITAVLCITANGNKLPPYIILNTENFCKYVIVCLGPKKMHGWNRG